MSLAVICLYKDGFMCVYQLIYPSPDYRKNTELSIPKMLAMCRRKGS